MENTLITKGYNLYMVGLNTWILDDHSGKLFDHRFKSVIEFAINRGFKLSELEIAVEQMMSNNHDSVHFGMNKNLIFTFNRKTKEMVS